MRNLILLLWVLLLGGCVTVMVPNTAPAQTVAVETILKCSPYEAPVRKKVPRQPTIGEASDNYTEYLESLAEQLAVYARSLRDYVADEHEAEDHALSEHQRSCRSL